MPSFEYICQECQHEFETLVFGRDKAKCPKCQSQKLNPQLSVFAMSTKGMPAKGFGLAGELYGGGPVEFHEIIRQWRANGEMKGLRFT